MSSKKINMSGKNGIRLLTNGKYCTEDIEIVPSGSENIIAENIRKDVEFLGVKGTLEAGGGSLPDPDEDGQALISINGEWKKQSGYGYETQETLDITWDGNPEHAVGVVTIPDAPVMYVRLSNDSILRTDIIGVAVTITSYDGSQVVHYIVQSDIHDAGIPGVYVTEQELLVAEQDADFGGILLTKGIYTIYYLEEQQQKFISNIHRNITVVHKIDSKYMPPMGSVPVATNDGQALVAIDGNWTVQEGYGYSLGGLNISWDGIVGDKYHVFLYGDEESEEKLMLVKVSDEIVDRNTLQNASCTIVAEYNGQIEEEVHVGIDYIEEPVENLILAIAEEFYIAVVVKEPVSMEGITFDYPGLYFALEVHKFAEELPPEIYYIKNLNAETIYKIDSKYLPKIYSEDEIWDIAQDATYDKPSTSKVQQMIDDSISNAIAEVY